MIATLVPARGSTSLSGRAPRPATRRIATSLWESNATASAGSVVPASVVTLVSVSPATTCAAVTTSPGRATQPLPSIPSPQAVPSTRTTLGAAARTPGRLSTRGSGGRVGTGGPARFGNGSIRPSAFSSVRGGTIEFSRLSTV